VSDVAWCHGSVCARSTYEEVAVDPVDGTVLGSAAGARTQVGASGADGPPVIASDEEGRSLLATDGALRSVDRSSVTVWETSYEVAFDGHPVDPENGYDGRSTRAGGWIVLLGPKLAMAEYEATSAGTRLPTSHVTVLGADGAVTAVWPDTYSCLDTDAPIYCTGHPVRTEDGYIDRAEGVIAFDERDGSVAWEATFPSPIEVNGDPLRAVLADGVAVLGTHDDAVVLDLQEGTVREASGIVAWCRDEPVRDEIELRGERGRWARAAQHHPCRMGRGGPSRGDELPPSLPSVVGHRHHDRWIWATDGTLHAVPGP
jgi:outer membrane protein assembly factor BamB